MRAQPEREVTLDARGATFCDRIVVLAGSFPRAAGVEVSLVVAGLVDEKGGEASNGTPDVVSKDPQFGVVEVGDRTARLVVWTTITPPASQQEL